MFNKFILSLMTVFLSFVMISCSNEEFEPGKKDLEDCHLISFMDANVVQSYELIPTKEDIPFKYSIKRSDDLIGNLEFTPELIDEEGVFQVEKVEFEDGQKVTESRIIFNASKAETGKKYTCTVKITDEHLASNYTNRYNALSFEVVMVAWNQIFGGENGEIKEGYFRDDIVGTSYLNELVEAKVKIEEREDIKGIYRIINPYVGITPQWSENWDDIETRPASLIINATDPNKVFIPMQKLGVQVNRKDGFLMAGTFDDAYGTMKNGIIKFPPKSIFLTFVNHKENKIPVNKNSGTRILLPGAFEPEYSINILKIGFANEGKQPISFSVGKDIDKIRYSCYKGKLDVTVAGENARLIAEGKVDMKEEKISHDISNVVNLDLTFDKTGVYTFVVAGIDEKGDYTGTYAYESLKYVAYGDENPVVLDLGLIISNKYANKGYTSENSVEFYFYGADLQELRWGLFRKADVPKDLAELELPNVLTTSELKEVCSSGFSGIVADLERGTTYVLVAKANNGYSEKIFSTNAKTEGVYDPRYTSYKLDDIAKGLLPETAAGYAGEYNYYAKDIYIEGQKSRKYLGDNVEIKVDENDPSLVHISSLLLQLASFYPDIQDVGSLDFSYARGILIMLPKDLSSLPAFKLDGQNLYCDFFLTADNKKQYYATTSQVLYAFYVREGFVALVGASFNDSSGKLATILGPYVGAFRDKDRTDHVGYIDNRNEILLVDKRIDVPVTQNEIQEVGEKCSAFIKSFAEQQSFYPTNYVESHRGRIESMLEKALTSKAKPVGSIVKRSNGKKFNG